MIVSLQVVKVWAMETGKKEFEFSVGRCGVSAMAVDKTGKRQGFYYSQAKRCYCL